MQKSFKGNMKKNKTIDLYALAEKEHIPIDEHCPEEIVAMSVRLSSGKKIISLSEDSAHLDPADSRSAYTKLECFAHEMGHCVTESFYEGYSPLERRSKHEHRANCWAVEYLMPFPEICQAIQEGYKEVWELAEYFNVSCAFVEKALQIHAQRGKVVPTT